MDIEKIKIAAEKLKPELILLRRDIHSHPELGLKETRTAALVAETLRDLGLEVSEKIGVTGVVGLLRGKNPGRTILLRADMDCLPMNELTSCEYKSENVGLMHACGHDAHVAWLLGAAKILASFKDEISGNIKFLFQPAEENHGGADKMIDDGVLENPTVDAAIGAHVWPNTEAGKIAIKYGPMMAAPDKFRISIKGKGGHGATPEKCIDPIFVANNVYSALQDLRNVLSESGETIVLSICRFSGGSAFNIIPDTAELEGTVRTVSEDLRLSMAKLMEAEIKPIVEALNATYTFEYLTYYPAVINDKAVTSLLEATASEYVGQANLDIMKSPVMLGEDFSFFLRKVPGVFFGVGTYNESKNIVHSLHSPYFDIDEDILPLASGLFATLALNFLNQEPSEEVQQQLV